MQRARSLPTHTTILPLICRSRTLDNIGAHRTTTHTTELTADEKWKQWAKTRRDRLAREPRKPQRKKKFPTRQHAAPYICLRAFVRRPPGTIELSEIGTLCSSGHKTLSTWNSDAICFREHQKINARGRPGKITGTRGPRERAKIGNNSKRPPVDVKLHE